MAAIACPHCRNLIENDPALAGQIVSCPHCQGQLRVPGLPPVAAPPLLPLIENPPRVAPRQASLGDPLAFLSDGPPTIPTARQTVPPSNRPERLYVGIAVSLALLAIVGIMAAVVAALNGNGVNQATQPTMPKASPSVAYQRPVQQPDPPRETVTQPIKPAARAAANGGERAIDKSADPKPIPIDAKTLAAAFQENPDAAAKAERAEDAATILKKAEGTWAKSLVLAHDNLSDEFDKALQEAVTNRDPAAIQSIKADRVPFHTQRIFPRSVAMRPYVNQYLHQRADADKKLIAAYDKAILMRKGEQEMAQASALQDELKQFGVEEAEIRDAIKTGIPLPASTRRLLKDFSILLHARITEIARLDTSVKRDDAHASMLRTFDDYLQKLTLTFRFPIKDVQHEPGGRNGWYTFSLSQPLEAAGVLGQSSFMATMTLEFQATEVAKIKPGDLFVVSGTPRIKSVQGAYIENIEGAVSAIQLQSDISRNSYNLYLQNFKIKIEHK